jgi:hypothetical protein
MQTITQKSKKGKYVLVFLVVIAIVVAIIFVLSMLENPYGEPYIDLEPASFAFVGLYHDWAGLSIINAGLITIGWIFLGALGMYAFYKIRGQQVKVAATMGNNYTPQTGASSSPVAGTTTEVS